MTIITELTYETGGYSETRAGEINFTERFIVRETDGNQITALDIRDSNVLPSFNTRLTGTNAYVTTRTLEADRKNHSVWYATLSYRTKQQTSSSEDPLDSNSMVDFDTVPMSYVIDKAYDDDDDQGSPTKEVLNTAGDPFDPPMTGEKQLDLIIIEKNYPSFDPADAKIFRDTMNEGALTIGGMPIGDGQGWMRLVKPRTQFKTDGQSYERVRFEILVNDEGWKRKPLSQGYYQYTGGVKAKKNVIRMSDISSDIDDDDDGDIPVTDPQRLGEDGSLLGPTATAHFMDFQVLFKKGWRALNLPVRKDGRA